MKKNNFVLLDFEAFGMMRIGKDAVYQTVEGAFERLNGVSMSIDEMEMIPTKKISGKYVTYKCIPTVFTLL